MTDEEIAEEYAEKECCETCKALICEEKCECWTFAKKGFLAGLEQGKDMVESDLATISYMKGAERYKSKWHDLRKNPNDLPGNGRRVLVKDKSRREYDIACLCRSKGCSAFWSYERFSTKDIENYVVAWCDFPRFEE